MTRAVCVFLLLAHLAAQAAGQTLLNASFEDPDPPDSAPSDRAAHWGRWGAWINRETGWTPTHSGRCLIGYHHWRTECPDSSGLYEDIGDIPAGTECAFSVFVCRDAGTNVEGVEICLEPYGGGEPLASKKYGVEELSEDRWHEIMVKAVNPTQGLRVLLVVRPATGHLRRGAIKFDDASLVCGAGAGVGADSLSAE